MYRPCCDSHAVAAHHPPPAACSAKDLVRKLLVVDPGRRLTAAECMKHPWVTAGQVSSDPLTEARSKMQVSV